MTKTLRDCKIYGDMTDVLKKKKKIKFSDVNEFLWNWEKLLKKVSNKKEIT